MPEPAALWTFLIIGYALSVFVELPVLWWTLSWRYTPAQKLLAGAWLTACTYPVVVLVLPPLLAGWPRWVYVVVAEVFAPAAECLLFAWAFWPRRVRVVVGPAGAVGVGWWRQHSGARDMAAIVLANLCSFAAGEALRALL